MSEAERVRDLVGGYRRAIAPVPSDRARIWARLQAPEEAVPIEEPPRGLGLAITIAIAVAAAVVLALGLAAELVERDAMTPRSQAVDVKVEAPPASADVRVEVVAPAIPPRVEIVDPVPPRVEVVEPAPPPVEPVTSRAPTSMRAVDPMRRELALVESARAAIERGDHATALARLREHARAFPKGVLRPEARALRAIALCGSDRAARGRDEARALLDDASVSLFHARLRDACALQ